MDGWMETGMDEKLSRQICTDGWTWRWMDTETDGQMMDRDGWIWVETDG